MLVLLPTRGGRPPGWMANRAPAGSGPANRWPAELGGKRAPAGFGRPKVRHLVFLVAQIPESSRIGQGRGLSRDCGRIGLRHADHLDSHVFEGGHEQVLPLGGGDATSRRGRQSTSRHGARDKGGARVVPPDEIGTGCCEPCAGRSHHSLDVSAVRSPHDGINGVMVQVENREQAGRDGSGGPPAPDRDGENGG